MIESVPWWMMILGFLLVLGPLVTVHELGHYLVGRWFGVKAEAFSIGFGKELVGWDDKRGTRWRISALPLGGYVQFKGDMDPASIPHPEEIAAMPPEERGDSFHHKPLWQRALIVAAGPVTNIAVAILIFAGFAMVYGKAVPVDPGAELEVAGFSETSSARAAGIEVGDRIVEIDGTRMVDFQDVRRSIAVYPGREIEVTVERGSEEITVPVTIASQEFVDRFGNRSKVGLIGVEGTQVEREFQSVGPLEALATAGQQCVDIVDLMITGIGQIISGVRPLSELGGPVKIAKFSGEQLSLGPDSFIFFIALISLNLAFINLLPIPALDGGHLAFYAIEAVRRKPVGPRGTELAYRTGVAIVLAFMVFVTVNDVVPFFR
ncbi:RIP metalloprotease RseP [Qipengyuania sp. JC766]|uniref:RIP metalloprotease RseP n=1 Tax=Qipengyuania sp. JC766 TaxID=3232139 RepID=UPI00345AFEBC